MTPPTPLSLSITPHHSHSRKNSGFWQDGNERPKLKKLSIGIQTDPTLDEVRMMNPLIHIYDPSHPYIFTLSSRYINPIPYPFIPFFPTPPLP